MGDLVDMGDVSGPTFQKKTTIEAAESVLKRLQEEDWKGSVGLLSVVITKDSLVDFAVSDSVDEATAITLATVVQHALCPLLLGADWDEDDGA